MVRAVVLLAVTVVAIGGCGGSAGPKRVTGPPLPGSPNIVSVPLPAGLSARERSQFLAGRVVFGQAGCLACHKLNSAGNDGPGPTLTHVGSKLRPQAIASTLRNPTAPMPSFRSLPRRRFAALVYFLSRLR